MTTHSELSGEALEAAGIPATMVRFAVGDEDPCDLVEHLIATARLIIDPAIPGFSERFPGIDQVNSLIQDAYVATHTRYIGSKRLRTI